MDFGLQSHLSPEEPSARFHLDSTMPPSVFMMWQADLRAALRETLGISGRIPSTAPDAQVISSQDMGAYTETKYHLTLGFVNIPLYILTPKTQPPYRPVLAFHGHGMGVRQILGHYPDDKTREEMLAADENYAQRLAEDGFLVCAIEQQGFGERITDVTNDGGNSCHHLATNYAGQGYTLLGERVREGLAVIHYLHTRNDVNLREISCVGHSGGGTTALFLSTLDTRIATTVISGYFCDFHASIYAMPHCACNYVPRLLTLANIGEIAATIAPRRLGFVNGEQDPIFPFAGFHTPYKVVKQAYAITTSPTNLSSETHPGGHQFDYAAARRWLG